MSGKSGTCLYCMFRIFLILSFFILYSCESKNNDFVYEKRKGYTDMKFKNSSINDMRILENEILLSGDFYTLSIEAENKEYKGCNIVFYNKYHPDRKSEHNFNYVSDINGDGLTDGIITNKGNVYRVNWNFEDELKPSVSLEIVKCK